MEKGLMLGAAKCIGIHILIKQPLSRYLKDSELSEDIEVGISHVTAFKKLTRQRPKYIKKKYDHGSHMNGISV